MRKQLENCRKKLASSLKKGHRRLSRIKQIRSRVKALKKKKSYTRSAVYKILKDAGVGVAELFKRTIDCAKNGNSGQKISANLRIFAITLFYYSPRCYRFVRKCFLGALPHPHTIHKWYRCVEGGAGFSPEAVKIMKQKFKESGSTEIPFTLVYDEMNIKIHLDFDGKRSYGFVDTGKELPQKRGEKAKEALVFLVVPMNKPYKIPLGYFLVNKLNANQKKKLIDKALTITHECGFNGELLVCDGAPSNLKVFGDATGIFSYNFSSFPCQTSFPHPVTKRPVSFMLDPVHCIKLVRNAWAHFSEFIDEDENKVEWRKIKLLAEKQSVLELKAANKLTKQHIDFNKQRMKVRLATQLLSRSVGASLKVCKERKYPEFLPIDGTIKFVEIFNNLFDVFNSRSPFSCGFKRSLCIDNRESIFEFLDEAESYIRKLLCSDGRTLVIDSRRRTGFIGFLMAIQSLRDLFQRLVVSPAVPMTFLNTYRFCQDHIEHIFGVIRQYGGWSNNPTARHFEAAWKKLLTHNQLSAVQTGNCSSPESIEILSVGSGSAKCSKGPSKASKVFLDEINNDKKGQTSTEETYQVCELPPSVDVHGEFSTNEDMERQIVCYIGGYIARWLMKSLRCENCKETMKNHGKLQDDGDTDDINSLIRKKNFGGLLFPSSDLFDVCLATEKFLKTSNMIEEVDLNVYQKATMLSYSFVTESVFEMEHHGSIDEVFDSHRWKLIRLIASRYIEIRLFSKVKFQNVEADLGLRQSRQQANRLVIFKGG